MSNRTLSDHKMFGEAANRWALVLGLSGLIPFYLPVLSFYLQGEEASATLVLPTLIYGCTILSFVGAVHWGVALARGEGLGTGRAAPWYIWSVVPALIAWIAAFGAPLQFIAGLGGGFLSALVVDWVAYRQGRYPRWFIQLRVVLTVGVLISLVLTAHTIGLGIG